MDPNPQPADVIVAGAVVNGGHHLLTLPATIESALRAAGGLARLQKMWPAGQITVRRPHVDGKLEVWRFNLEDRQSWEHFVLRSGDAVIFAWHVEVGSGPEAGSRS